MSKSEPRFSVVMPAHDAAATIGSAIRSVLRQTVEDLELIVVDDGSGDETLAVVRELQSDSRVVLVEQPNRGPSAARNTGIAAASAATISVIDSDDLWLPTYLEAMESTLEAAPGAGFAYTDAWLFDDVRRLVSTQSAMENSRPPEPVPADPETFLLELLERNFVYTSATIRRAVLRDVGGYDERLRYGEDFELWARILGRGYPAVRAPGRLAIHRKQATSLTADVRAFYAGICSVYRLILAEHALGPAERRVAERRLDAWEGHLGDLERPSPKSAALTRLRRLRSHLRDRRRWPRAIPAAVAETLAACEGPGAAGRLA